MTPALQFAARVLEGEDPKNIFRRMTSRKGLEVGEAIIHCTCITRDVLDACLCRLAQLDPEQHAAELEDSDVKAYLEYGDSAQLPNFDPEYYTYEHLCRVMQKYCPPCTYFGSYEADGTIGCWPPGHTDRAELAAIGKLTLFDENDEPEHCDAIRRGDYTGITTRYVILDAGGGLELWDSTRHRKIWTF